MLGYWQRILMMLGLFGMTSLAMAQGRLLSDSELDNLRTWFPRFRIDTDFFPVPPPSSLPASYESIAQLVDSIARRESVQALQLTPEILKEGQLERLAELTELRALYLQVDSATTTPALFRALGQLKHVQQLSLFQHTNDTFKADISTALATSLRLMSSLHDLKCQLQLTDPAPLLTTLSTLPNLRKLTFMIRTGGPAVLPAELGNFRQLTSLMIRNYGQQLQSLTPLGQLTQLRELKLNFVARNQDTDWSFLSKLTNLETLLLMGNSLRSVPDLKNLKKLRTLDLGSNNNITISADAFQGLTTLEKLDLHSCRLNQLPASVTQLTSLKELTLSTNHLLELPAEIGALKQLEVLQADACQLRKLPVSLANLNQLRRLVLSNNRLDTLDFRIDQLTQLKVLDIQNNKIHHLPPSIGQLTMLESLLASQNGIVQIPESIEKLTRLTRLSLNNNRLTRLPEGIAKLTRLREFDLGGNQLQQLPAGMGQLHQLQRITLGSNQLTQLPTSLSELDSLHTIDLSSNQLTSLPDALFRLTRLQNLNVYNNQLTALPPAIGNLTQLRTLDLSTNRLTGFPTEIGKLIQLYNLNLTTNRLTSFPAEVGKLTELRRLSIGGNPLETLPEAISQCRNLNALHAANTKLKSLPESIGRLTRLQELYLTRNELTILPASLGNLTRLRTLQLGRTRLLALPESIGRLTHLMSLQVGEMEDVATSDQSGLRQLPDSLVYCRELNTLQLMNQPSLDADDVFAKVRQLPNLQNLTLFNCNLERIPELDWKSVPLRSLSLMRNRLTELPVAILESPWLSTVTLSDNLLPEPLNTYFNNKEVLRLAFSEAGLLPLEAIAKPNRNIANAFVQKAIQKASQRDWANALTNFEKAIDFASDTLRMDIYQRRADLHISRQEYAEAITDLDQSLAIAGRLTKGIPANQPARKLPFEQPTLAALRSRAHAKGQLGQPDAAAADIEQAVQRLNRMTANPDLAGSLFTEQGRYRTLKNKIKEAGESYRKAITEYEKLPYTNTGTKLTVPELYLLTGQPDQARKALKRLEKRELVGGFATLEKYLACSIQVLNNEKPDADVLADLKAYLASHSEPIMGWSFELFENWLPRSGLPAPKQATLHQLTQFTKERLMKTN